MISQNCTSVLRFFSGTGVLFHVPNNMYDWTVGAIISGLGRGAASCSPAGNSLSLCARSFLRAPPPAPPAVPVWPPRARWRRDWRLLFRRGSKQGVCPAPRVLRLSWPCLPLPATHTLTRVAAWVGPQDHAAGPESLDTGCRPSWARRCTTRRSSTTVRAARSSPVRIRSHCRGTAHEPRPASAAAAGAASGSTPTSLPGTRSTHPLSLFSTVLSSGPVASALALATGLGRCLPGV